MGVSVEGRSWRRIFEGLADGRLDKACGISIYFGYLASGDVGIGAESAARVAIDDAKAGKAVDVWVEGAAEQLDVGQRAARVVDASTVPPAPTIIRPR